MASARPTLARLRARRAPAWWQDAKLGIFVHWTPASVPAFAPVLGDYDELLASGRPDAFQYSPYVEWYENSLRFPDSPAARHHREVWGDRPYRSFAGRLRGRPRGVGSRRRGRPHSPPPGRATWCWCPSTPTAGACGRPRSAIPTCPAGTRSATWWASWPRRCAGRGMRFGLYYSGGLDSTFHEFPMGSMGGVLAAIPRGDYPAYAEAQVRELIDRYRPSVLWNDIAWPAPGGSCGRSSTTTTGRCPTVWSMTGGCPGLP